MHVPANDSLHEIQASIREIMDEIRSMRKDLDSVSKGGDPSNIDALLKRVASIERGTTTLDFNDVFRGSGPAHAMGYVPDPGESASDERVLVENGGFGFPLRGQARPATNTGVLGEQQLPGDILCVNGSMALIGNLSCDTIRARRFIGYTQHPVNYIQRGGILVNPNGITATINVIAWRAPYDCTVLRVYGYRVGGTSASINARRNGTDNHLSSGLSLTSADTWMGAGAVQNTAYVFGDKLEIMLTVVAGSPTQIGVLVELSVP